MANSKTTAGKGKLKLFKTVIGFHDAYVAAPSQKAALEAWGASTDLFGAKLAERVDDAGVCNAAFDKPGAIITAKRGTKKEWSKRPRSKPKGRPKAELARANIEQRIAALDKRHAKALATLDSKIEELGAKRAALERSFAADREKLSAERDAI